MRSSANSGPRRRVTQIHELPFRHATKTIGIEVFRLSELYARAERGVLDHELDTPRRLRFHTIYVGLRGRGAIVVDFVRAPLGAGFMTFVARGRVLQFVPDRGTDAWMILVEPELVSSPLLSPGWYGPSIEIPAGERGELEQLAELIAVEHARPVDRVQPSLLQSLTSILLLRGERLRADVTPPPPVIASFFSTLERDCTSTRSVAHYARACALSPRRLGEVLVAFCGKSTKQLIDEHVVVAIKRLLVHTQLSIEELAERTSFAESTNLVKFFRLHTAQTPTAFRAAHRMFLPSGRGS